jgi:Mg-chelatase subunit ChlD
MVLSCGGALPLPHGLRQCPATASRHGEAEMLRRLPLVHYRN